MIERQVEKKVKAHVSDFSPQKKEQGIRPIAWKI
jgi:hypothetical protein